MKKPVLLSILLLALTLAVQAQKLSKDEAAKFENEINTMITYLEETMNFIGDSATLPVEKEIVFTESWSKIFIDDKVQIEDDLDVNRKTPINKDVQAYLKDIDFFFKQAVFRLDLQSISNNIRDDGSVFFKVTLTRHLSATTITDEVIDNVRNRFVEINLDRQNNSLKIASIYTSKINEKDELRNWWNSLSLNWKRRLGNDIRLYDSIPLPTVGMITATDFVGSYVVVDSKGDTTLHEKLFKDDMDELDAKLKLVSQKQRLDLSGIREIISLEPISELSDLTWLDISETSIEDLSPVRNLNKLKVLRANSTMADDLTALKYNITLKELEVANTAVEDLSVLAALHGLEKLNVANTRVVRLTYLKNCTSLTSLNLSGTHIPNIHVLQDLPQLKIVDISNTTVRDLGPLSDLKEMQSLNISGTAVVNLQPLSELENLRELFCSNTAVSNLMPLQGNRRLSKIYCDQTNIHDTEASEFTKNNPLALVIYDTEALKTWWHELPIYWKAVFSRQIQLDSEPTTEQLHQIINMQELDLSGNTYLQNLMPVNRLTNLRSLDISHTEINLLLPIHGLANLESLNIEHTYVGDLKPLQDMTNLRFLNIMNTPVADLSPLMDDNRLEVVLADSTIIGKNQVMALKENQRQATIVYQTQILRTWWEGLDPIWKAIFRKALAIQNEFPDALELQRIIDLREVEISPDFPINSVQPLANLNWLERLTINNQGVSDLNPLAHKTYLVELNVQNNPVSDLKPLENSVMLELINIENTQIDDFGPLSKMNNLVTLNASGTPVKSLKPLAGLQKLENLFVNNTNVRSISPVENIPALKQLKIYNTKVKKRAVEQLQQKRLDLNIIYY